MQEKFRLDSRCGSSDIFVEEGLDRLQTLVAGRHTLILTDERIYMLHGSRFPDMEVIRIPQGEQAKSLGRATLVYQELIRHNIDKASLLIAVGGGVITDLGGFVATTYLRGIGLGFVPTTLLAQVDAALGGKNGVNLGDYKNMVGTIRQPEFILIDPSFLKTLPREEFISGLAEVVKYGLISDPEILDMLEDKDADEVALDGELLAGIISRSVRAKIRVVEEDEDDSGIRRILNFGHTYGHGIERLYDLSHGRAVAYGMRVALVLSEKMGLLEKGVRERALRIMRRLELIPDIYPDNDRVMEIIGHDKKKRGDTIAFVLLRTPGVTEIIPLTPEEIARHLKEMSDEQ
jgi:3-dehydroquinate synthase